MNVGLEPYLVARRVGGVLDASLVPWAIGGSLASSVHGLPRSTADIDLVTAMGADDIDAVVGALSHMGYVDRDAARHAVRTRRSFNLIDDASLMKVDLFCVRGEAAGQIERSSRYELAPDLVVPIVGPEDIIVQKLRWYDLGGRVSDRQLGDVRDVLRVQGDRLDLDLLRALAAAERIGELMAQELARLRDGG